MESEGEEGGRERGRGEGRSTYGDTVVAGEPDSYKQPHEEAKSCWGGTGRVNAREENKEKSEHKRERGEKKGVERRIKCVHFAHIERLTYDGKDEGVSEIVVERQFHIVLPQTQCSSCGHKRREDVESCQETNSSSTVGMGMRLT